MRFRALCGIALTLWTVPSLAVSSSRTGQRTEVLEVRNTPWPEGAKIDNRIEVPASAASMKALACGAFATVIESLATHRILALGQTSWNFDGSVPVWRTNCDSSHLDLADSDVRTSVRVLNSSKALGYSARVTTTRTMEYAPAIGPDLDGAYRILSFGEAASYTAAGYHLATLEKPYLSVTILMNQNQIARLARSMANVENACGAATSQLTYVIAECLHTAEFECERALKHPEGGGVRERVRSKADWRFANAVLGCREISSTPPP